MSPDFLEYSGCLGIMFLHEDSNLSEIKIFIKIFFCVSSFKFGLKDNSES